MGLTNENVGPKILAKIKIYVLTRAELLFQVCYEIPCRGGVFFTRILGGPYQIQGFQFHIQEGFFHQNFRPQLSLPA